MTTNPKEKKEDPITTAYALYDAGKLEEAAKIFEEQGFKYMAKAIRKELESKKEES